MEDSDAIEALAFGEVQMIAASLSLFDRLTHRFQIFDLPFLFPNLDAVERFQQSRMGQRCSERSSDKGMLGLAFWHNGMKQIGAPRPLRIPADAAGPQVPDHGIGHSPGADAGVRRQPQKMAFGEVYQALQTGTVDAQENTWSNMYSSKFYEVQPYITETTTAISATSSRRTPRSGNRLPADIRSGARGDLNEVTEWGNARAAEINREDKQNIAESGRSEIIELTPAELAAWRQAMLPVWDQFRDVIGADLIEAAQHAAGGSP